MRHLLFFCLILLAVVACNPTRHLFAPSPEKALAKLTAKHPELLRPDTITIHDTVTVAKIEVQTRYVPVPNVVRERRDSLQLDSLLNQLSASLDTAQRKAAQANIHRLIRQRPVFPDTLCFDTLGVHGRIWQQGKTYFIRLTRDEIKTPHQARQAIQRLTPCQCESVIWYDPRTWPWLWLLAGFLAGIALCLILRRS